MSIQPEAQGRILTAPVFAEAQALAAKAVSEAGISIVKTPLCWLKLNSAGEPICQEATMVVNGGLRLRSRYNAEVDSLLLLGTLTGPDGQEPRLVELIYVDDGAPRSLVFDLDILRGLPTTAVTLMVAPTMSETQAAAAAVLQQQVPSRTGGPKIWLSWLEHRADGIGVPEVSYITVMGGVAGHELLVFGQRWLAGRQQRYVHLRYDGNREAYSLGLQKP